MNARPVVLVGSPRDAHIEAVARELVAGEVDTVVVDTLEFPDRPAITLGEQMDAITVDGRDLGHPAAVYVRDIYAQPLAIGLDIDDEMAQDWRRTLIAFREKAHVLYSLLGRWAELGVPCYNPMTADWRLTKPMQISLLHHAGLPVPPTVWTNDPDAVTEFAGERRVAYKPVAGGAATKELGPQDLTEERLGALRGAPVTFQMLLPGDNYRVYVLDGDVIATFRITADSLDYRQQGEKLEQVELPTSALNSCLAAAAALGLRWSGMDLKADDEGNLQFLELNSSPMFLGFDRNGGSDILGALSAALAGHFRAAV